MLDKIIAAISALMLIGFMSFVVIFVNEPDLWIVVLLVLALMIIDFVRTLRKGPNEPSS